MDEATLANLACSLMFELIDALDDHVPDKAQIVVREIPHWPNGPSSMWVMVNWPN